MKEEKKRVDHEYHSPSNCNLFKSKGPSLAKPEGERLTKMHGIDEQKGREEREKKPDICSTANLSYSTTSSAAVRKRALRGQALSGGKKEERGEMTGQCFSGFPHRRGGGL